jgi:hypothetical protein
VEKLLSEQLSEVGINIEQFVEACGTANFARRDINRQVYDQIVAMDDYLTFKKLMVRRHRCTRQNIRVLCRIDSG